MQRHLLWSIARKPGDVQVQGLVFVVLDRSEAITILVARADTFFKSPFALLSHHLKKGPGFFWQRTDNADIKRLDRFFHSISLQDEASSSEPSPFLREHSDSSFT